MDKEVGMKLQRELKKAWRFLSGQSQWTPDWMDKLPGWTLPIYIGDDCFRWLGVKIKTYQPLCGETLFMYWRRVIKVYKRPEHNYIVFQFGIHSFRLGHNGTLNTTYSTYKSPRLWLVAVWILGVFMQYDWSTLDGGPNYD